MFLMTNDVRPKISKANGNRLLELTMLGQLLHKLEGNH
jgi:hypothetical protein